MNKLEAKNLIVNTFEKPFNEAQFTLFIKNLLNNLDESKRKEYRGQYVPESFSDAVKHYKRIGQYKDSKNNVIDVLIVNLNRGTSLERARSLQRNFTARYLKQRIHDAALVAYYTDGNNDWRFSLVKMDINLNDKKIETDFTPARRYSFLVGTNDFEIYRSLSLPMIGDVYKGHGPLSGIHASLIASPTNRNFFLSCDLPLMSQEMISHIIEYKTVQPISIPSANERMQHLCGIYRKSLVPVIENILSDSIHLKKENGKSAASVKKLISKVGAEIIETGSLPFYKEDLFFNMNSPDDFEIIKQKNLE